MSAFEDIDGFILTDTMRESFKNDGIDRPSPVQLESIPAILQGRHAV
ncbi:MAG: hypothetical protein HOI23_19695, partial [Deltaproteobacteria bacterium]|nr:hypothetical protein [Deltaproteobacteria bacterium]